MQGVVGLLLWPNGGVAKPSHSHWTLCEILCARPSLIRNANNEQVSLAELTRQGITMDSLIDQKVNPFMKGKIVP